MGMGKDTYLPFPSWVGGGGVENEEEKGRIAWPGWLL